MSRAVEVSMFPELRAHKAVGPLVPSVIAGTNADLIAAIAPIYLTGSVIDLTYGEGGWWKRHRPTRLEVFEGDFTKPIVGKWDTVCFDPPYVEVGGKDTSTAGEFQARYGLDTPRSHAQLIQLIRAGLENAARATDRYLLVKCMDFVASRKFNALTYMVAEIAIEQLGMWLHDEIIHHAGSGPGGHNIVDQLRARRCHSKLLVFTWERL